MLQVTKLTGPAGSGKSVALEAIHNAMTSQGRQCLALSGGGRPESTILAISRHVNEHDRFKPVILLEDATDDLVERITASISQPGFLYAAVIG
jgi:DNA repair ATPase RecN